MIDSDVSTEFIRARGLLKGIPVGKMREYLSKFPDDYQVFTNMDGIKVGEATNVRITMPICEPLSNTL